ncbi:MAG: methylated-DNA--[protein]-cysteine S-methyltransferase [Gemmatimonadaceae bacterium]|nr:methylated-DNA--[protein]-cysteine S-methyltransferase [Gemmatimonadaceae bacterium]
MPTAHYLTFPTAFGTCGLAWSDVGLLRVQLPDSDERATVARLRRAGAEAASDTPPAWLTDCMSLVTRHLSGDPTDYRHLPLDDRALAAGERAIYAALRSVGWGETITYGTLARATGAPGDARVVGRAMARNPWPVVVPCHRVLAAGQSLGGFSAPGGVATKVRLLALEGIRPGGGPPEQPDLFDDAPG